MPKQTPRLVLGALSNRVYIVTHYKEGPKKDVIEAAEKFDVTDQLGALLIELKKRGLELAPVRDGV